MQLTYPGVYVTEIPSSVRPIATVSTSIGAFVDVFPQGVVDQAVQIFGMADFERNFGGVTANSAASYQIAQFFLNGGPSAWVVRVAPGAATPALAASATSFTVSAASPGSWGTALRFTIEPVIDAGVVSAKAFNLTVSRYASKDAVGAPIATERFNALSIDPASVRYFPTVVNGTSLLVTLTPAGATPTMPATNGTLGDQLDPTAPLSTYDNKTLKVTVGAVTVTATVKVPDAQKTLTDLRILRGLVESAIRTAANAAVPPASLTANLTVSLVGNGLWVELDPRAKGYLPSLKAVIDAATFGFQAATVATVFEYALVTASATPDGTTPTANDIIGDEGLHTGMHALDKADLFNLLCLPQVSDMAAGDMAYAFSRALDYCIQRRAFFLIDPPSSIKSPPDMVTWVNANASLIESPNSAIYYPRVEIPDPLNNFQMKSIGPSGTVAGIYAKTDNDRGVWKAPAGIDAILRGVAGLDYLLSDGENGVLNPLGIDCLRNFPVYGQIVWGARTLYGADARASEWKYVPIRRLALMIEESLFRGTKWVVFEPNDEPLWAKIRQNVGAFMTTLFRQGAFQGSTPDKAFFVKCDGETTTAADRNLGVVNIEVGFAPLKPAEFVVLKIQQIPDLT